LALAQILVHVTDVNDNRPTFISSAQMIIVENAPKGTIIGVVKAIDMDDRLNGQVQYRLDRSVDGIFSIDPVLGYVKLNRAIIDRERQSEYNITVIAYDLGDESFSTTQLINIRIIDINDHHPQFVDHQHHIDIAENVFIDNQIIKLDAVDRDTDANCALIFRIESGNHDQYFAINPESGQITVNRQLDYELIVDYNLTISVENLIGSVGDKQLTWLHIHVTDVNDNAPQFARNPIYIQVFENVDGPFPIAIGSTLADDADSGVNGNLAYSIIQGNTSVFGVNSITGQLYVNMMLDREMDDSYELLVQVTDSGMVRLAIFNLTIEDNFFHR
jgi:hypothetical protein